MRPFATLNHAELCAATRRLRRAAMTAARNGNAQSARGFAAAAARAESMARDMVRADAKPAPVDAAIDRFSVALVTVLQVIAVALFLTTIATEADTIQTQAAAFLWSLLMFPTLALLKRMVRT